MSNWKSSDSLKKEKWDAIRISKQLCYPEEVRDKIKMAQSIPEVFRILTTARHQMYGTI